MIDKEKIYDEQISPLLLQIVEIAKKHEINYLACFHISTEEDPQRTCVTIIAHPGEPEPPQPMLRAMVEVMPPKLQKEYLRKVAA